MTLEFFIKLREMVSSGLVKMANTARQTANSIKGANGQLAQSYDELRNRINSLESAISKSRSVSYIREAKRELADLQRMAARSPGNLERTGFFGGLANQVRGFIPALGIAGLLSLGGNVLGAGLQGQARQASFEVMAGKTAGTQLNQDLTKFAQDSIYGNELYQNAQTMLAFGASVKEVMPDLRMLGDVAMGNKERLGSLTLAFSQVRAAGKLTGQDLLQFVNAGFNPLQVISAKTGVSMSTLREQMSEGLITFDQVKKAFQSATGEGGKFFNMTERIAQTDFGKWEAFKGQLAGVALQLGGSLAPAFGFLITNVLVPLTNILSGVISYIQQNAEVFQLLAIAVGTGTAAYMIYTTAINGASLATNLLAGAQRILNFVMSLNPIGLVIAALSALVAVVIYAWNKFDWFRGGIMAMWEVMKGFGTTLKEYVIDRFTAILSLAGSLGTALAKLFKGDFSGAWDTAKNALSTYNNATAAANQRAKDNLVTTAKNGMAAYAAEVKGGKTTPASVPDGSLAPSAPLAANADETVKGITGGGPRVININGVKFAEKIEIHSTTLEGGLDSVKEKLDEYLLRTLNSGSAVQ